MLLLLLPILAVLLLTVALLLDSVWLLVDCLTLPYSTFTECLIKNTNVNQDDNKFSKFAES